MAGWVEGPAVCLQTKHSQVNCMATSE